MTATTAPSDKPPRMFSFVRLQCGGLQEYFPGRVMDERWSSKLHSALPAFTYFARNAVPLKLAEYLVLNQKHS